MKLTDKHKTDYLNLGLRLLNISTDNQTTELIWRCYDGILKKKGNWSLEDSIRLEIEVNGVYREKEIKLFESQKKVTDYRTKARIYGRLKNTNGKQAN